MEEDVVACANAAVIFVGNKLMLDEGIGAACYEYLNEHFVIPDNVEMRDVGCMSLDMIPFVRDFDLIITVDAVDGTDEPAGTVFRFSPEDMARHNGAMASLHDLKLVDLFDAAMLLGYTSQGVCLGMQVLNMEPAEYTVGLTEPCYAALPLLARTVVGELARYGIAVAEVGKDCAAGEAGAARPAGAAGGACEASEGCDADVAGGQRGDAASSQRGDAGGSQRGDAGGV